MIKNSKNTVACFRDFLGKEYGLTAWEPCYPCTTSLTPDSFKSIDPTNNHNSAHPIDAGSAVSFSIQDTADSEATSSRSVQEITTRHLRRLQHSAADYLGRDVNAAVFTVPTDFTDAQKKALTEAAAATDLEIVQFIPEPVSALLSYDAKDPQGSSKDRIVVVGDFGATRSDVAVIAARGGIHTILATEHDFETAGLQLDQVLLDHAAKEYIKKHKKDPRQDARALAKLRLEAEAVKKALSQGTSAQFSFDMLLDGNDFSLTINRARYETLAAKPLASLTRLIEAAVEKAGLDKLDITDIILSGGSSNTPKLARNVQSAFGPTVTVKAPAIRIDALLPSELTVRGAAVQASLIAEFDKSDVEQSIHPAVTVTPHLNKAIGLSTVGSAGAADVFTPLIAADTPVPVRRTVQMTAAADGDVLIKLCEGTSEIKVSKAEPKVNGDKKDAGSDDDSDDDSDEDEEEEDVREKIWKTGNGVAELALRAVKKNAKIEIQVSVDAELGVQVTARELGGKGGVRGSVEGSK